MTGKGAESSKDVLAELVVRAAQSVVDDDGSVDTDNIRIETVVGGATDESELVEGVIVDKERVHDNMPFAVEDADVALLDTALEVRRPNSTRKSTSPTPTSSSSSSTRKRNS